MSHWRLFALLVLVPALVLAAPPKPYVAKYEVRRDDSKVGIATVNFSALGKNRYQLKSSTVGTDGMAVLIGVAIDELSVLRWPDNYPETVTYAYSQKTFLKTNEKSFTVDAAHKKIDLRDKSTQYSPPYREGVLDRNTITVALMQDLAAGKTGDLLYWVPSKGELENQRFRVSAGETLDTALGRQRTLRVERIRESANGRSTVYWFGPDRGFMLLQFRQTEKNGEKLDMRITSLHH